MKFSYEDLTPEEKDFLTDGCGNHFLDVPDFLWTESCRRHDFEYWSGHTKKDRSNADWDWFLNMLRDVDRADPATLNHSPLVYKGVALLYLVAVRLFSGKYFEYGDRYKTRADLEVEMRNGDVQ
jgi:hypothetical protein